MTKDELLKQLEELKGFISFVEVPKKNRRSAGLYVWDVHYYMEKDGVATYCHSQILEKELKAYWLGNNPLEEVDENQAIKDAVLEKVKEPCIFSLTAEKGIIGVTVYRGKDKVKPTDYLVRMNPDLEMLEIIKPEK